MNTTSNKELGLFSEIDAILKEHLRYRVNRDAEAGRLGKHNTSYKTQETRANAIIKSFQELQALGFKIPSPTSLRQDHMKALIKYWDEGNDANGFKSQANATIANKLSHLRIFCDWMGKPKLVRKMSFYFEGRPERHAVSKATTIDRRPASHGIDEEALFKVARATDERYGTMLRMARHFGLRLREILMFTASVGIDQTLERLVLPKNKGPKGGRPRLVPFASEGSALRAKQDQLLREVREFCVGARALGWFDGEVNGLKRGRTRFSELAKQIGLTKAGIGFTPHSLRAAYGTDLLISKGYTPPVAGGDGTEPKFVKDRAIKETSLALGHNRPAGPSYYGKTTFSDEGASRVSGTPANIFYVEGDIFDAKVEALVNPVNTAGVMGKGLAKEFKTRFPKNFLAYVAACQTGRMSVGKINYTEVPLSQPLRFIVNFPTKQDWKNPSKLEWITKGLESLKSFIQYQKVHTIALPALGAGLGGLDWEEVKTEVEKALGGIDCLVNVYVHRPSTKDPKGTL